MGGPFEDRKFETVCIQFDEERGLERIPIDLFVYRYAWNQIYCILTDEWCIRRHARVRSAGGIKINAPGDIRCGGKLLRN